jgi:hypothetical protein
MTKPFNLTTLKDVVTQFAAPAKLGGSTISPSFNFLVTGGLPDGRI